MGLHLPPSQVSPYLHCHSRIRILISSFGWSRRKITYFSPAFPAVLLIGQEVLAFAVTISLTIVTLGLAFAVLAGLSIFTLPPVD